LFDPTLLESWLVDLSHVDLSQVKVGKEWMQLDGGLLPNPFTTGASAPGARDRVWLAAMDRQSAERLYGAALVRRALQLAGGTRSSLVALGRR
jgi:hypothetical protein